MNTKQLEKDIARFVLCRLRAFDFPNFLREIERDFDRQFPLQGQEEVEGEAKQVLLAAFGLLRFLDSDVGKLARIGIGPLILATGPISGWGVFTALGIGPPGLALWKWFATDKPGEARPKLATNSLVEIITQACEAHGIGPEKILDAIFQRLCKVTEIVARQEAEEGASADIQAIEN